MIMMVVAARIKTCTKCSRLSVLLIRITPIIKSIFNLLKPTGHVMHQQFNI